MRENKKSFLNFSKFFYTILHLSIQTVNLSPMEYPIYTRRAI